MAKKPTRSIITQTIDEKIKELNNYKTPAERKLQLQREVDFFNYGIC